MRRIVLSLVPPERGLKRVDHADPAAAEVLSLVPPERGLKQAGLPVDHGASVLSLVPPERGLKPFIQMEKPEVWCSASFRPNAD